MQSALPRIVVALMVIAVISSSLGCRSLRQRRVDRRVLEARNLSAQGIDLLDRRELEAAESRFAAAISQCPSDERAHWGVAQTLWERGERQQAIVHMTEAIRWSGDNPDYRVRLGEMHLDCGDCEAALTIADSILANRRDHAGAWRLAGRAHAAQRHWDKALTAYQRSLLLRPDDPDVQLALAEIYRHMHRPDRSLATIDRVLDHHPAMHLDGELQLSKGLALADLERPEAAFEAFEVARRQLAPDQLDQRLQLTAALHRLGRRAEADQALAALQQDHPSSAEVQRLAAVFGYDFSHLAGLPNVELGDGQMTTWR